MKIVNKKIKNSISKENRKYFTLVSILLFSLTLEITILVLVLLRHELVLNEPIHKIIFMCLIFIGTIWSLYSIIATRKKIIVSIKMENNQVEITSIGLGSSVHKYLVTDLNIKEMPNESKKNTTFVKVCNSNGELLFLCSSDFLNTDELQNSEFKFLNELGKKLIT